MRFHRSTLMVLTGSAALLQASRLSATLLLGLDRSGTGSTLYDIDPESGTASNPRPLIYDGLVGIAFATDGTLYSISDAYGVAPGSLFTIDPGSGSMTMIANTGLNSYEGDLDFDPTTGMLYHVRAEVPGTHAGSSLQIIDTNDGSVSIVGFFPSSRYVCALAFHPQGILFGLDHEADQLVTIDPLTAAILTSLPLSSAVDAYAAMDFDPATETLYVADRLPNSGAPTIFTVDTATGALSSVGPTGLAAGLTGLAFVPEPGTFTFLLLSAHILLRRTLTEKRP